MESPMRFLEGYSGVLQSDSYSVYKSLERQGKTVHVGCWSHARRGFYDAKDEHPEFSRLVLAAIQKLFRLDRTARAEGLSGDALVERRRAESLPILERLRKILEAKRPEVTPKSGTGEAIGYALRHWEALTRYIEIPEAPPHNNSAESSLRGVVLGRKNWLFVGHPDAGPRAAVILSLIETCRRLGIEPLEYLKSVIAELAKHPERASELTPRKWRDRAEKTPGRSVG